MQSAPFYVTNSGKLYCNGAVIEGDVAATKGKIGSGDVYWTIDRNGFYLHTTIGK